MAKRIQVEKITVFGAKALARLFPKANIKWVSATSGKLIRRDPKGRFLPSKEFTLAPVVLVHPTQGVLK